MADFKFEDTNQPEGFNWDKFKIVVTEDKASVSIPALITWSKNLAEPEVDDEGRKKWYVAGAIPKTKATEPLMKAIRDAEAAIAKASGIKGPFPSAFRDGDAKDGSGMFLKSGGKLAGFWYFSSKTRKAPRIVERGSGTGYLDVDAASVNAGGYCMLNTGMIMIGYGSDSKKGSSLWLNSLLWMGGGNQIGGGGGMSDEEAYGFAGSADAPAGDGKADSFI